MLLTAILPLLLIVGCVLQVHCRIIVRTRVGDIVGFEENWGDKRLHKFHGIPFAEAPIGDLRFRPPVSKARFQKPFNANKFGHPCPQYEDWLSQINFSAEPQNSITSEDCLSLNIYVPVGGEKKKPVMVWIHGGGFLFGAGMQYDGSKLAAIGDVIFVSFNYRLNLLGFFTTGDDSAPGNYGLFDQHLAMRWVNENIGTFGGDTTRVTIHGVSAGSGSATWHMLSRMNTGLFHRVIAESGTALAPWAYPEPKTAIAYTKVLADKLRCTNEDSKLLVACLRKLPRGDFNTTVMGYPYSESFGGRPVVGPRVDGILFDSDPNSRLKGERMEDQEFFKSLDLMIGTNKYEGSPFIAMSSEPMYKAQTNHSLYDGVPREVFNQFVDSMGVGEAEANNAAKDALWWLYGTANNGNTKDMMQAKELLEFIGDASFYESTVKFVKRHAMASEKKTGSTHLYSFLPRPSKIIGGMSKVIEPEPFVDGAIHGDEVGFLFGSGATEGNKDRLAAGELELSNAMVRYWTNFAKTGDPNKPIPVSYEWPQYKVGEEEFLEFDIKNGLPDFSVNSFFRNKYISFWHDVLRNVKSTENTRCISEETCQG